MADKNTLGRGAENVSEFSTFALEEAEDNRILRASLWVAVGFHLLLLLINFPAFEGRVEAVPKNDDIYIVVPTPIWQEPLVPKTTIPPTVEKKVPVPDPTPHDPEPLPVDEPPTEVNLPVVDVDYFPIPDAPPAPPAPEGPIAVGGDVTKPIKIHAPQPHYTEIARKARIQGYVIVQAIIDKRGDVTNVRVIKGLPMGLTEETVKAVKQWKFEAATLRGKPVDVYYNLTINFQLQ
jgi:TonB family protein